MRVPHFRGKKPQGLCALCFALKHTLSLLLTTTLLPTSIPLNQAIAFIVTHPPQTHQNKSQPLDLNPTTQTPTNLHPNADPNTTQSPPQTPTQTLTQSPPKCQPKHHPECRSKHHPVASPNADPNTTQIQLKRQPNFDPNPPNDNHNYLFLLH